MDFDREPGLAGRCGVDRRVQLVRLPLRSCGRRSGEWHRTGDAVRGSAAGVEVSALRRRQGRVHGRPASGMRRVAAILNATAGAVTPARIAIIRAELDADAVWVTTSLADAERAFDAIVAR